MKEIIIDTLLDALKILPFLFIAFLIIELIEHKLSEKSLKTISKSGKVGPFFGSLFGLIPQCGFSVLATNLYITRIISLGSLISVYLATSDEMLPIMISEQVAPKTIITILSIKFIVGLICGFVIDFILRKKHKEDFHIHEMCDHDHCHCEEEGILKSSIFHTLKTILFIILITFVLNVLMKYVGKNLYQE